MKQYKVVMLKWKNFSAQQKLLMVVAVAIVTFAFFIFLDIWGIETPKEIKGKIGGTAIIVAITAAILIAILSNMKDAKKDDKDIFFN